LSIQPTKVLKKESEEDSEDDEFKDVKKKK